MIRAGDDILRHRPQSIEALRMRFTRAVDHLTDIEAAQIGVATHVGLDDRHVFDFKDGLRIILSVDVGEGLPFTPCVHWSASAEPGSLAWHALLTLGRSRSPAWILKAFEQMCQLELPLNYKLVFPTEKGCPHFLAAVPASWPTAQVKP